MSDGLDTSDRYTSHPLNSYDYSICLIRAPLLSLLSVENGPTFKFKPFKSPLQGHVPGTKINNLGSSAESQRKTLGCKIKSLNNYSCRQFIKSSRSNLEIDDVDYSDVDPLVLYTPSPESKILKPVVVDPMLSKYAYFYYIVKISNLNAILTTYFSEICLKTFVNIYIYPK